MDARQTLVLVREIGSFHVGGGLLTLAGLPLRQRGSTRGGPVRTVDPNGEIAAGQMFAQYVRLAEPRGRFPVLMWHGGGMSGVNWETTPDGRVGWQMLFLRTYSIGQECEPLGPGSNPLGWQTQLQTGRDELAEASGLKVCTGDSYSQRQSSRSRRRKRRRTSRRHHARWAALGLEAATIDERPLGVSTGDDVGRSRVRHL